MLDRDIIMASVGGGAILTIGIGDGIIIACHVAIVIIEAILITTITAIHILAYTFTMVDKPGLESSHGRLLATNRRCALLFLGLGA